MSNEVSSTPESQPKMEAASSGNASAARADNIKLFVFGVLGCLVLVLIGVFAIGAYRVYAKTDSDPFTMFIAKTFRLPAMKINGDTVSYVDYIGDLHAITTMRAYDKTNNGPGASLTDQEMSDQVLIRQANNVLVAEGAQKYGVTVSSSDIQNVVQQDLLSQFKSESEANQALEARYGWSLAQYEQNVVKPYALENNLAQKVQADPALRAVVKAKAQSVLDQIKAGADFATLAKKYGEDGTAQNGGDLGWFGRGEMVPQFENAVFSLKKGELDQNLVESPYGYHIVKLVDTKTEKAKDPTTGKMVDKELVRASHILFLYPSVDDYLNNLLKVSSIHVYIHVHNPFPDLIASVASSTAAQ